MLIISNSVAMARALDSPLDPSLTAVLQLRLSQLTDRNNLDLAEVASFLIVEEGDGLTQVEAQLGFSPLVNLVDGTRFGDPDFTPSWEWIEPHHGWLELAFVFTDDGFAHVLLVKDSDGVDWNLLQLCRAYSENIILHVGSNEPAETEAIEPS